MWHGPQWSQSEGGPLAHAAMALVVPKQRRPPHPCGGGPRGPKAKEAPGPMWQGPRWSQSEGGPLAQGRGPRWSQSEGGPLAMRPGPPWSHSEGGPLAHAAMAPVVP